MKIIPYLTFTPQIDPTAFIAPGAVIIGDVVIGAGSSVWPGCVLRGDIGPIRIGAKTNIQDGTVIHVNHGVQSTQIGDGVTVGHMALLHDCIIEDGGFVGMRATMLDGSRVESGGMLAAGALLTSGKVVKTGQLWSGAPAKFWRDLTPDERVTFAERAEGYASLAEAYK